MNDIQRMWRNNSFDIMMFMSDVEKIYTEVSMLIS